MRFTLVKVRRESTYMALSSPDLEGLKCECIFAHAVDDILLSQTPNEFFECVRECDTVSRFSGDEFVIFPENINSTICQRI